MKQITEITNESNQKFVLIGEAGQEINFELSFKPTQQSWYYNLTFEDLTINGQKLVTGPNILRAFRNTINFGITVQTEDLTEPFRIDDFVNNRVQLYLLNETDVESVEQGLFE